MTINDAMIELCEDCEWYDRCITPCDKFVEVVKEDEKKMNELKPCPFCGREAVIKRSSDFTYYVMCGKCEVKTYKYIVKSDAIKAWNRRTDNG